jgi:broad specificity polyphosphatase/5'/3'-nucleotidase SurE
MKAFNAIVAALVVVSALSAWSAELHNDNAPKVGTEQAQQSVQPAKNSDSEREQYVESAKDGRGTGTDWSGRKDQDTDKSESKLERR